MFHQNKTRQHILIVTRQKLRKLSWVVLMHPTYYLDLEPSDSYLFLSMTNDFAGEKFDSREACENRLAQFFFQIAAMVFIKVALLNYLQNGNR